MYHPPVVVSDCAVLVNWIGATVAAATGVTVLKMGFYDRAKEMYNFLLFLYFQKDEVEWFQPVQQSEKGLSEQQWQGGRAGWSVWACPVRAEGAGYSKWLGVGGSSLPSDWNPEKQNQTVYIYIFFFYWNTKTELLFNNT